MILKFTITPSMRMKLHHAESILINLNELDEVQDLQASAAEAHLHINILHSVIKSGDLRVATKIMADWEDSQCQC